MTAAPSPALRGAVQPGSARLNGRTGRAQAAPSRSGRKPTAIHPEDPPRAPLSVPRLSLQPRGVAMALAGVGLALVCASVAVHLLAAATGHDHMLGLRPLFDLDTERNLPSLFSTLLLLCVALLLALLGQVLRAARPREARRWLLLAAIATAMAVDEAVGIHELLIEPMRRVLGGWSGGVLHFAWVVPGALLVAAFLLAFWRFQATLPQPLRWRVQLAGVLYVGGALGVELISGRHVALHGIDNLAYSAGLVTLEEGLEMAGILLSLHALLSHLAGLAPELRLALGTAPVRQPHPRAALRRPLVARDRSAVLLRPPPRTASPGRPSLQ